MSDEVMSDSDRDSFVRFGKVFGLCSSLFMLIICLLAIYQGNASLAGAAGFCCGFASMAIISLTEVRS